MSGCLQNFFNDVKVEKMERKNWFVRAFEGINDCWQWFVSGLKKQGNYIMFLSSILATHSVIYFAVHCTCPIGYEMTTISSDDATFIDEKLKLIENADSTKLLSQDSLRDLIRNHLEIKFPNWDTTTKSGLLKDIYATPSIARVSVLSKVKILERSFFWLYSSSAYWEIMFWTVFGVLASLLYFVAEVIRNKKVAFDHTEIPSQLSKLFYAPIISLILVFSYNYFTDGSGIDIQANKGVLIVSFLLGFYSGRAMELLNRVKELLLPYSETYKVNQGKDSTNIPAQEVTVDLDIPQNEVPQGIDYEGVKNQLGKAVVKLTNTVTQEVITLEKSGEEQDGIFKGNAKPVVHLIQAELTTAEGLHYSIEGKIDVSQIQTQVLNLKLKEHQG